MSSQPTYTEAQLEAYLKRIGYPDTKGTVLEEVREKIKADCLATLSDLQRRHLCAIPWGNSGLHYSQHHTISLHPETLFEKIVERRLDGYCMENSGVFFVVLRSLGFHVYATGGRVSRAAATGVDDGRYMSLCAILVSGVI
jgi:arylamine N-acetyltransferase